MRDRPTAAPATTAPAWWALDAAETLARLGTSDEGLSPDEVSRRLARDGPNEIPGEAGINPWRLLLEQVASPLIYILIIAGIVTVIIGEYIDAAIIGFVVVLDAALGFVQEYRAERSIEALRRLASVRARVLRGGRERDIDATQLVGGDIILVEAGYRVPADARLLQSVALEADESLLTGESTTVAKRPAPVEADAPLADRTSMLHTGTIITRGRARAAVVETGLETQVGRIAGRLREVGETEAPLQKRMDQFARLIGIAVLALFVVGFAVGLLLGEDPENLFLTLVALAVSAIPEGLPVVLTLTLAIGVTRMARRNVIIRKLPAVETLGSTTVIGSDKTGTLTQNRMTVREIYAGGRGYELTGVGYSTAGEIRSGGQAVAPDASSALRMTLLVGALSNDADLAEEDGEFEVQGDPTEIALLVSAAKAGMFRDDLEERYPRWAEIPFDSERRYSATFHRIDRREYVFVKGAPERVLRMCDSAEGSAQLDEKAVLDEAARMARGGLRVLAMAYREIEATGEEDIHEHLSGLVFAGLQAMMDPPREEAKAAVAATAVAGIRAVMITGDHATTALAIAQQVGIAQEGDVAWSGHDIDRATDDELLEAVQYVPVFARVSPDHKLRITDALRRQGHVTAITGDGVNDAPALKAADIGVAMGRTGTDVAKEAADMIITDDNFASIVAAVEEGRTAFDNVRKVTFFLVSAGVAEVIAVLASILVGFRLPFLPAQLLWLNLVTNGIQDIALAFEPADPDIIKRPPRPRKEGVISALLWERIGLTGAVMAAGTLALFLYEIETGTSTEEARTIALTTMVLFQVFHVGNSRSEYLSAFAKSPLANPILFVGTVVSLAVHVAALYLPPTQYILRVEPLDLTNWLLMAAVASSIIAVGEIHKFVRHRERMFPPAAPVTARAG